MCILIVDDSEDCRSAFKTVLARGGYRDVVMAESAGVAFAFLGLHDPDAPRADVGLVLLDIVLPDLDGTKACERIRRDPRYADVPVVVTTALSDTRNMEGAFDCGATDYLTKPIKAVDLLACVRSKLALKAEFERRNARERELSMYMPFQFSLPPEPRRQRLSQPAMR